MKDRSDDPLHHERPLRRMVVIASMTPPGPLSIGGLPPRRLVLINNAILQRSGEDSSKSAHYRDHWNIYAYIHGCMCVCVCVYVYMYGHDGINISHYCLVIRHI